MSPEFGPKTAFDTFAQLTSSHLRLLQIFNCDHTSFINKGTMGEVSYAVGFSSKNSQSYIKTFIFSMKNSFFYYK